MNNIFDLPLVKTLSTCIYLPSLNFCCSIARSVEYLNAYVDSDWPGFIEYNPDHIRNEDENEVLGLQKYIYDKCWEKNISIYKPNAWTIFPRLKVLTIFEGGLRARHEDYKN